MNLCPSCTAMLDEGELCPSHTNQPHSTAPPYQQWDSRVNRIWNDYFMRGVPIPRLADAIEPALPQMEFTPGVDWAYWE